MLNSETAASIDPNPKKAGRVVPYVCHNCAKWSAQSAFIKSFLQFLMKLLSVHTVHRVLCFIQGGIKSNMDKYEILEKDERHYSSKTKLGKGKGSLHNQMDSNKQ